jgi:hypothetical protein
MTPRIPKNISTWLVDWSLVANVDDTMPPRDPNDDDEDHDDDEDEDDENQADEPAVVREPDDE